MHEMNNIQQRLEKLGIGIPEILLPGNPDLQRWSVIACDQFTQDRSYWEKAKEAAGGSPSTLNLILPEVYLADTGRLERIEDIHRTMRTYLDTGVFSTPRRGFVYLERDTPFNRKRKGLVVAVDLEQYDWHPSARPLIRATEGTVPERLPPRMDIRRNAPFELTHIIMLIDDDTDTLLPGLAERTKNTPVYQGDLMQNSGRVSGWFLDADEGGSSGLAFLAGGLEELSRRAVFRYADETKIHEQEACQPFLFAVGDGNHSLATAKGIWEEYKAAGAAPDHPSRYALVEIENIYDPAIQFEPIHRIVFGIGFDETLKLLSALPGFSCEKLTDREVMTRLVAEPIQGNRFGVAAKDQYALVTTSATGISTASLQPLLERAESGSAGISVDYIHGTDDLLRLACAPEKKATGILLPPVQKAGLFETVARHGPLPRKSFSMGEAEEKRFYLECRKLFG